MDTSISTMQETSLRVSDLNIYLSASSSSHLVVEIKWHCMFDKKRIILLPSMDIVSRIMLEHKVTEDIRLVRSSMILHLHWIF